MEEIFYACMAIITICLTLCAITCCFLMVLSLLAPIIKQFKKK